MTRTEATPEVFARRAAAEGVTVEEIEAQMARRNSINYIPDAEDVAYVITMLASPRSIAINGDTIAV